MSYMYTVASATYSSLLLRMLLDVKGAMSARNFSGASPSCTVGKFCERVPTIAYIDHSGPQFTSVIFLEYIHAKKWSD